MQGRGLELVTSWPQGRRTNHSGAHACVKRKGKGSHSGLAGKPRSGIFEIPDLELDQPDEAPAGLRGGKQGKAPGDHPIQARRDRRDYPAIPNSEAPKSGSGVTLRFFGSYHIFCLFLHFIRDFGQIATPWGTYILTILDSNLFCCAIKNFKKWK